MSDDFYRHLVVYWDSGIRSLPPLLQRISLHNIEMCKIYNHTYDLFQKWSSFQFCKRLRHFIKYSLDHLSLAQQADYIRYFLLHQFGGIWLDTDNIITGNLSSIWNKLPPKGTLFFEEFPGKLGNSVIASHPSSPIMALLLSYTLGQLDLVEQRRLQSRLYMERDFIGPKAVQSVVRTILSDNLVNVQIVPDSELVTIAPYIVIIAGTITTKSNNFASWDKVHTYAYSVWYKDTQQQARKQAEEIWSFGLPIVGTWTLYTLPDLATIGTMTSLLSSTSSTWPYHSLHTRNTHDRLEIS